MKNRHSLQCDVFKSLCDNFGTHFTKPFLGQHKMKIVDSYLVSAYLVSLVITVWISPIFVTEKLFVQPYCNWP